MSKCIKCGRELKSAEIPEFYNGMCEKCYKEKNYAEYPFKQGINDYQNQIDQLKQENEKLFLQLSKQEIDEHKPVYCTLAGNDCKYLGKIKELRQQLAKKDKEIEKLNKTLEMCKHIERYDIGEMFLENAKLIIEKRQLAIQELEKVKVNLKDRITMMSNEEHSYLQKVVIWYDICNQVNKQIKELKGE